MTTSRRSFALLALGLLGMGIAGFLIAIADAPSDGRHEMSVIAAIAFPGAGLLGLLAGFVAWRTREWGGRSVSRSAMQGITSVGSVVGIAVAATFAGRPGSAMIPGVLLVVIASAIFTLLFLRRAADAAAGQPPDPGREP
ncbi:MAG: hypothetical protein R2731_14470 [Nocardioides sp.]